MVFILLLAAAFGAAALVFAQQNLDPVSLSFLHWHSRSLPLALIVMAAALVGMIVAALGGFAENFRLRLRVRVLERQLTTLVADRRPVVGPVAPSVVLEPVRDPARDPEVARKRLYEVPPRAEASSR